jgi:hypothetical protein
MIVPKAPWSAVALATALSFGIQGASFAAALQGVSRTFMQSGEPRIMESALRITANGLRMTAWKRFSAASLAPPSPSLYAQEVP